MSLSKKKVCERLLSQWNTMLENGTIPYMEYPLNSGDFLLVRLEPRFKSNENTGNEELLGFEFSFSEEKKPFFSGAITGKKGNYYLKADKYFDSLDYYLQAIDEEMREGYMLPHNLDLREEE